MTITTFRTFIDDVVDMDIPGVVKIQSGPPDSVNPTSLPLAWVDFPESDEEPWTAAGGGGWPTIRCDLFLIHDPVGTGISAASLFDKTVLNMDNLLTGLRTLDASRSKVSWNITRGIPVVANIEYWGFRVRIEGHG